MELKRIPPDSPNRLTDKEVKAQIAELCKKYAEDYKKEHPNSPFLETGDGSFLGYHRQLIHPHIKNEEINPWIARLAPELTPKDVFFFAYDTGISTPVLFTGGAVLISRHKIYWKSLWGPLKHSEDLDNIIGFKYQYTGPSRSGDYNMVIYRRDYTHAEIPFLEDYQEDFLNDMLDILHVNP